MGEAKSRGIFEQRKAAAITRAKENMMNNKLQIGVPIPNIGGQQQLQFNPAHAQKMVCKGCGGELFDSALRLGMISKFAPGNQTKQDVIIQVPAFVCRNPDCGLEVGKEPGPK